MKMKYLLTIILTFLLIMPKVNAYACDEEDLANKKKNIEGITITAEYAKDENDNDTGNYNIIIKDIPEGTYILDTKTNTGYYYDELEEKGILRIKNLETGNYKFEIQSEECEGDLLKTITYRLPKYNHYANNSLCEGIDEEELEVCNRAYQGEVTDEIFRQEIEKYNKKTGNNNNEQKDNDTSNKIIEILKDYYIYIIAGVILIIVITSIVIINKRRGTLE